MITIVNYGMGNLGSIFNMLKHIGIESIITNDIKKIENSEKIILPGVGAFDSAIDRILAIDGLIDVLNELIIVKKVPILGICLGMQLFTKSSEEGKLPGLGWIDAYTKRFVHKNELKVPHMGWNVVILCKKSTLTQGMYEEEQRFYFVHSYHLFCNDENNIIGKTFYGEWFPSIIEYNNIFGVQFHPEKSHRFGMKLLKNFAQL